MGISYTHWKYKIFSNLYAHVENGCYTEYCLWILRKVYGIVCVELAKHWCYLRTCDVSCCHTMTKNDCWFYASAHFLISIIVESYVSYFPFSPSAVFVGFIPTSVYSIHPHCPTHNIEEFKIILPHISPSLLSITLFLFRWNQTKDTKKNTHTHCLQ